MHLGRNWQVVLAIVILISTGLYVGADRQHVFSESKGTKPLHPIVIPESSHDVSPPMRTLNAAASRQIRSNYRYLKTGRPSSRMMASSVVGQVAASVGLNFEGIDAPSGGNYPAPDPNGAVGARQYVQAVNTYFAVFDKSSGALLLGPTPLVNLWSGLSAPCGTSAEGDPIAQYDKIADRWIISHHATLSSGSYYECIAVSTTSDATGSFYAYAFQVSNLWPDYPKMGVWPDAYYFSYDLLNQNNEFQFVSSFVCAFERTAMLQGKTAISVCFQLSSTFGNRLLPADLDGSSLPSSGEPNFFLNTDNAKPGLNLWQFHVDFQTPGNSTLTGPTFLGASTFTPACVAGYHLCIPQLGTSQRLDGSGGSTLVPGGLMYRLAYRHFPNGPEVLLAVHSIAPGATLDWYEIRNPAVAPWVHQQGTFAPDSNYRWNASIAMDQLGDIAIGYNVSGPSINPAIRYAGRVPSDPLGTLETEASIIEGTGSEEGSGRWGDYSSLSVDPTDDCTFWYTSEYLQTSGDLNWNTRIASFKFPSCN